MLAASCGQKQGGDTAGSMAVSAAQAIAPDVAADAAAAARTPKDQPNFRVCLSNSLDNGADDAPLAVPAGAIFISWGDKKGDERNPSLDANQLAPGAIRYVVVLDRPVTLSKATPCDETVAQAATSALYEWYLPLVRNSQTLQFQVYGVENHLSYPLTDRLGDLVKRGVIFGYPTADIGNPRMLNAED
jgi:hypothetical protein